MFLTISRSHTIRELAPPPKLTPTDLDQFDHIANSILSAVEKGNQPIRWNLN